MNSKNSHKHWLEIGENESYRLTMAEFKGATMQALKDLDKRIGNLESYNNNTRYISMFIAGVSGVFSGIFGSVIKK